MAARAVEEVNGSCNCLGAGFDLGYCNDIVFFGGPCHSKGLFGNGATIRQL
jgi:hypothetical protein